MVFKSTNSSGQRAKRENEARYEQVLVLWVEVEEDHHQKVCAVAEVGEKVVPALCVVVRKLKGKLSGESEGVSFVVEVVGVASEDIGLDDNLENSKNEYHFVLESSEGCRLDVSLQDLFLLLEVLRNFIPFLVNVTNLFSSKRPDAFTCFNGKLSCDVVSKVNDFIKLTKFHVSKHFKVSDCFFQLVGVVILSTISLF